MTSGSIPLLMTLARPDAGVARIREVCPAADVRIGPCIDDYGQHVPAELMRGAKGLLCEIPPENFDDFDALEWIHLTSVGYSQIFKLPILERGIRVTNARGTFDVPIAEWCILMLLMWQRDGRQLLRNQQDRYWDRSPHFTQELRGSTVGIYGYGGIGRELARLSKAMGMTVWTLTRDGSVQSRPLTYCVPGTGDPQGTLPDRVFRRDDLPEFLGGIDFLVLAMPLTDRTAGLIGEAALRMLKPSAVLLNPARAGLIQQEPLLRCLREQWIRGLSLDTHYAYPLPPDHPLWSMPNVILTPHISGHAGTDKFFERAFDIVAANVDRYCTGQSLLNELTPSQIGGQ
jgi:phosphoglycerate dehydrogenase-like enzyme